MCYDDKGRVVVIRDTNVRVGEVENVINRFGARGMNQNGGKLIDLSIEKNVSVRNTFFSGLLKRVNARA